MTDILIIGGGPAGLSAATTAKLRNKDVCVIKNDISTSALYSAERVDNYLGMRSITGKEMLDKFTKHAEQMGVKMIECKVQQIMSMGDYFSVSAGQAVYDAKTLIIATGNKTVPKIKGEGEFLGKGLSYCATCDGMLYKGKTVVIIGENKEAAYDAQFLSEICSKVYFVTNSNLKIGTAANLEVVNGKVLSINGDIKVKSVNISNNIINCDGVFIVSDNIPTASLIYGIATENGLIKTNRLMHTNLKGVFAAGDCIGKPYQISKAVGDGLVAATSAVWHLSEISG